MSSVSRLLDYLDFKKVKKSQFYKDTGVSNGYLDKVKELGSDKIEIILSIYPLLNVEWLITGKGSMEKDISMLSHNNVFDFVSAGAAGEAMLLLNEDKYRVEKNLYIPELGHGIHIRTPVSGDSMHSTIKDGDRAVSTLITDVKDIRQGYIYAILDKLDGLVYKRLYFDTKNSLEFCSDNEIYRPYKRHISEIGAIFKVREVHTKDLRPYFDDIRKDIRHLKEQMYDVERQLKQIK